MVGPKHESGHGRYVSVAIDSRQQLLHYRLTEKIGEGGMGVVWKAVDTTLDREVAIKILPDSVAEDPERLARFAREAKLLASLNHPNIASVYGLHQAPQAEPRAGGMHFLAMELVEGEDLSTALQRGPFSVEQALGYAGQIAEAPRGGPREGSRPPRPQAGQPAHHARGQDQGARFRPGQGVRC